MSGLAPYLNFSEKSLSLFRSTQDLLNNVMRNNNFKNQNTQLPAQVATELTNMNVLPAIGSVKATLHHIDVNVSVEDLLYKLHMVFARC